MFENRSWLCWFVLEMLILRYVEGPVRQFAAVCFSAFEPLFQDGLRPVDFQNEPPGCTVFGGFPCHSHVSEVLVVSLEIMV